MKALTLWEPYATLIAAGFKEVETRGWYTSYRGELAIHAGKSKAVGEDMSRITFALAHHGFELPELVYGAVLCVVRLVACVPTALVEVSAPKLRPAFAPKRGWEFERQFGNYDAGRWAWILTGLRCYHPPVPANGSRKLWDFTPPPSREQPVQSE